MNEFEDTFSLAAQSRATGFRENEQAIRCAGPTNLNLETKMNNASVPSELQHDRLPTDSYFYTLPPKLWDALLEHVGRSAFDAKLLELEETSAKQNGDHSHRVGFFQSFPVTLCGLVDLPSPPWTDEYLRAAGMDPVQVRYSLNVCKEQYGSMLSRSRSSYLGWLLTNPKFLQEHDQLLKEHLETVQRYGLWNLALRKTAVRGGLFEERLEDPHWHRFVDACRPFLQRWRLARLVGPYLPEPVTLQMSGLVSKSDLEWMMETGGIFYLPDTIPIPSRDQLRKLLDDSLHKGPKPVHLEDWLKIVNAGNTARNRLDREARLFSLWHFYQLLVDRHATALKNNRGRVEDAFAQFFGVDKATIHHDLVEVPKRLAGYERRRLLLAIHH